MWVGADKCPEGSGSGGLQGEALLGHREGPAVPRAVGLPACQELRTSFLRALPASLLHTPQHSTPRHLPGLCQVGLLQEVSMKAPEVLSYLFQVSTSEKQPC